MNKDKLINITKKTQSLFGEKNMSVYAGNATLFLVTALFPLLMLILSIINQLPGYSPDVVVDTIFRFVPDSASLKSFINVIADNLQNVSGGLLTSVSAITTFWSASSGVRAIQKGLKVLEGIENRTVKDIAAALIFTLLVILFIPAILIMQIFGDSLIGIVANIIAKSGKTDISNLIMNVINTGTVITAIGGFFLLLFMYTYLPGVRRSMKTQLPGTILAYAVLILFTRLFALYIPRFYSSSALYGSLATLFLLLLYLRLVVTLLFYGAAFNEAVWEYR